MLQFFVSLKLLGFVVEDGIERGRSKEWTEEMEYFTSLSDKEFQTTLLLCQELSVLYHVILLCPVKEN